MWYLTDKRHLDHDTGPGHPERPDRLRAVWDALAREGLCSSLRPLQYKPAESEAIHRVHSPAMFEHTVKFTRRGFGNLTPDTPVCQDSASVALLAAGAACAAVDAVVEAGTQSSRAFCAIRPPGHHATPDEAMGFCLINSAAVAARHAQTVHGIGKVLVLDWDVHHGNGTQDIFYSDPSVGFISIHRYGQGFYPGTGAPAETGTGKGLGSTWNLSAQPGISWTGYLDLLDRALSHLQAFKPDLVIVSAGFDACLDDPVGDIGLDPAIFGEATRRLLQAADATAGGRIVSLLEGGYNLKRLGEAVAHHVKALIPKATPSQSRK